MATNLLPPNSTGFERNLAQACADIELVDTAVIVQVVDADNAPVDFLPYLAWEVSVDRWSDAWPEATKRKVIKESFFVHKRKGTIGSLRRVVEPFGYLLQVFEWFEQIPPAPRGTFSLDIGVSDSGITEEIYDELWRLIEDTKPLSRHISGLRIVLLSRGTIHIGTVALHGEITTVYPPSPQPINVESGSSMHAATHLIDIITVRPL